MNFSITANEQSYQSIYVNPEAKNWQEVIVFHEPIFDDEIPGVVALKSLRLENCLGFVLGAPRNRIRYFREKAKEIDANEQLGKKAPRDILKRLLLLTEEVGGSVVYIQNEHIEGPKENIPGTKGVEKKKKIKHKRTERSKQREEMDSFFDPLTKRKLVTIGPQYFDPSLPTMTEEEKKAVSFLNNKDQLIHSPAKRVYPENINPANLGFWDKSFDKATYNFDDNKTRWDFAKAKYEEVCGQLELSPYKTKQLTSWNLILSDILSSTEHAINYTREITQHLAENNITSSQINGKVWFEDVTIQDDSFYIISKLQIPLLKKPLNVLGYIHSHYDFKYAVVSEIKNIFKQLDERTSVTITDLNNNKYLLAYVSYKLPVEGAKKLFQTDDLNMLRLGLIRSYTR